MRRGGFALRGRESAASIKPIIKLAYDPTSAGWPAQLTAIAFDQLYIIIIIILV